MPLVAAAILPHGFPLIPLLSDDADGAMRTRRAMEAVGRRFTDQGVEAIVLAGPHGIRVDGAICLANVARGAGTLHWRGRQVEMNVPCDRALIEAIADACRRDGIPLALAGFGGNRPEQSVAPLDWGAIVPLWFIGHGQHRPGLGHVLAEAVPDGEDGPPVVLVTPSRSLPRDTMLAFGATLARVAQASGRRIAFVASCDWAHTHAASGPYGYHPKAAEVDARVMEAVREGDLAQLLRLPEDDVQQAAIDGLWQLLMLAGVQQEVPLGGDLLSYEVSGYYGMIVAAYARSDA